MSTVQILGTWDLPLLEGRGGHYQYLDSVSSKNAACFYQLLQDQGIQADSVVEYFGGVGIFSTIIQQALAPSRHLVFELDGDCVAQLRTIPKLVVTQGDARETMGTVNGELAVCDFPLATLKTIHEWPIERVAARRPRYIVVSDTALRRLGLHRELYTRLSGEPVVTLADYVRVYSRAMWERCGYSVIRVAHHVYSYFLLAPYLVVEPTITKVTSATPRNDEDRVGAISDQLRGASLD